MTTKATSSKPAPLGRGLSALFGDTDAAYKPRTLPQQQGGGQQGGGQGHGQNQSAAPASTPTAMPEKIPEKIQVQETRYLDDNKLQRMMQENCSESSKQTFVIIPIDNIVSSRFQTRLHFSEESLSELASSIVKNGIIQPLVIRPIGPKEPDMYELIAGERRWRAASMIGLRVVPAIIRNFTDQQALESNLIENIERADLSAIEEAEGYQRLLNEFNYTQDLLALLVGKSRPHITNLLRLLKLPEEVKRMVIRGELSARNARALLPSKDPVALAKLAIEKKLGARQIEALVKEEGQDTPKRKQRVSSHSDPNIVALERNLSVTLGLKTKIHLFSQKTGSVTVHYTSVDQFEEIVRKLQRGD